MGLVEGLCAILDDFYGGEIGFEHRLIVDEIKSLKRSIASLVFYEVGNYAHFYLRYDVFSMADICWLIFVNKIHAMRDRNICAAFELTDSQRGY